MNEEERQRRHARLIFIVFSLFVVASLVSIAIFMYVQMTLPDEVPVAFADRLIGTNLL
ncbi:hypothetical protein LOK74_09465 [Brevibacillus humidisoli]|uniref:hypothetical protein n=1 Tax=Brevibacillus humidisoli TaxID=2895522 RepID=UPI001E3651D5|nr:hypothetical protein [Brevibacillus humidisoli]UFJ42696.1 hypothetical protein LOK74_09465 [Brevibacillus humidisoli]